MAILSRSKVELNAKNETTRFSAVDETLFFLLIELTWRSAGTRRDKYL